MYKLKTIVETSREIKITATRPDNLEVNSEFTIKKDSNGHYIASSGTRIHTVELEAILNLLQDLDKELEPN